MTQPLIRLLRLQHLGLLRLLAELQETFEARRAEALPGLLALEAPLLEHLSLEDDSFYPALRELAGDDPRKQAALAGLRGDLEKLREEAAAFFDRCKGAAELLPSLEAGFGHLSERLRERMALEETQLYLAYDAVYDPDETLH
ncbi:MAG TPA: hemerythrin domain-containing protein [Holophagaceae bacterium]|nr:hemerythrin domain-containing protein [Holophagaceae bacterium]